MVAQRMRDYELVMVLSPEAGDEEISAITDRVANFITEHSGTVTVKDNWGLRRLAYPIQRFREGNYVLNRFSVDPNSMVELGRILNASEQVLRHLITKIGDTSMTEEPVAASEEEVVVETEAAVEEDKTSDETATSEGDAAPDSEQV